MLSRFSAPARAVSILPLAARRIVGTVGPEVVIPVLARALILVGVPPRVFRALILLQIRAVPPLGTGVPHERFKPLPLVGVPSDVEAELIERRPEKLDLRLSGCNLGFPDATEESGPHERGEEPQDDDDDQQLDERGPTPLPCCVL